MLALPPQAGQGVDTSIAGGPSESVIEGCVFLRKPVSTEPNPDSHALHASRATQTMSLERNAGEQSPIAYTMRGPFGYRGTPNSQ